VTVSVRRSFETLNSLGAFIQLSLALENGSLRRFPDRRNPGN
jgi:hypothetical protein